MLFPAPGIPDDHDHAGRILGDRVELREIVTVDRTRRVARVELAFDRHAEAGDVPVPDPAEREAVGRVAVLAVVAALERVAARLEADRVEIDAPAVGRRDHEADRQVVGAADVPEGASAATARSKPSSATSTARSRSS